MPIRSRLIIGAAVIGAAAGLCRVAPAETRDAVTTVDCQDRFLLDRRDHPDAALKNFHQCTAIENVSRTLESFTFWYVTLPERPHPAEDSWFVKIWRDDTGILTSPSVALGEQKATAVLDDSIARGLRRGKRDDLVDKWRSTHNPQVLLAGQPKPAQPQLASAEPPTAGMVPAPKPPGTAKPVPVVPPGPIAVVVPPPVPAEPPKSAAAAPAPSPQPAPERVEPPKTAAAMPPAKIEPPRASEPAAPARVEPPKRAFRTIRRRYVRYEPGPAPVAAPTADQLNRAEAPGWPYAPAIPSGVPQAYYPVSTTPPYYPPASAYYPISAPVAYAPPPAVQPPVVLLPAPVVHEAPAPVFAAPPPPPVSASLQPRVQPQPAAMPVQPVAPAAAASPTYAKAESPLRTIPQQVDLNIRTIAGLINSNIETIQRAVFGTTLGLPAPR